MWRYTGPCTSVGLTREVVEKALAVEVEAYGLLLNLLPTREMRVALYNIVVAYEFCCVQSKRAGGLLLIEDAKHSLPPLRTPLIGECFLCHNSNVKLSICQKCESVMTCSDCLQKKHTEFQCNLCIEALKEIKPFLTSSAKYCACCGNSNPKQLRACGRCRELMYCSVNCQKRDWKKAHKRECSKISCNTKQDKR